MLDEDRSEPGHQDSETDISEFFSKKCWLAVKDIAQYISIEDTNISNVTQDIVEYISGLSVRKLNLKLKCEACLEAIEKNVRANGKGLLAIKDRGGLILPDEDVVNICTICEKKNFSGAKRTEKN